MNPSSDAKSSLKLLKKKVKLKRRRSREFDSNVVPTSTPHENVETFDNHVKQGVYETEQSGEMLDMGHSVDNVVVGSFSSTECHNDQNYETNVPTSSEISMPKSIPDTSDSKSYQKLVVVWRCNECGSECIPVRDESRCLW